MRCRLVDSLTWLYPDSIVPAEPAQSLQVDVPRGGTAAVQILVTGADSPVGIRTPDAKTRVFHLLPVPVETNTGAIGFTEKPGEPQNPFVTRRAPFRVFDVMKPVDGNVQPPANGDALAFCVHVPIAPKDRPGCRQCTIDVLSGSAKATLSLAVNVHSVRVPPIGPASLKYTNWFSLELMAKRHNLKMWSPDHWAMIRRYARMMAEARQNMFWLQAADIFESRKDQPRLDAARLNRIVDIFTDAGMYYIEGPHFAARPDGRWLAKRFVLALNPKIQATSPEGIEWVARIGRQLQAQIDRRHWSKRWVQHVADEPIDENADDYRILAGAVRKYMPGVRIIEATLCKAVAGAIDIWVPQNWHFERDRDFLARQQTLGDEVWHYTCCFPGGQYLNRLMDGQLLRPTLLHWGNALYDLPGFLHWGLNHYRPFQDPFQQSVVDHGGGNALPAGDTHVVYPGTDGPWSSVRLQAQREGLEDYELLRMLKTRNPRKHKAVLAKVIRSFCDYTTDLALFRQTRRELLQTLD